MHEMSIANSIIDAVLSEVEKKKANRVKEINIDVGELMQVDTQLLSETIRMLIAGSKLEGARVIVHVNAATFSCRKCGTLWSMREAKKELSQVPDHLWIREPDSKELPLHFMPYLYNTFIHCPKCGSSDVATSDSAEDILLRRLVME
jgi:Zn finger protein HypA/HybF involved in hydrogenase expression